MAAPARGASPEAADPDARRRAWEDRTQEPLTVAALVFLVAFVVPLYVNRLPPRVSTAISVVSIVVWALFAIDYAVQLWLAHRRWRFVVTHPLQLALVLLPALRPLAALRLAPLVRVALAATHTTHRARRLARARLTAAAVVVVIVLVVVCGGLALQAERAAPDASITSPGQALWWALATVTTVGYGDTYPVTTSGRLVATVLMVIGIAVLGVVSASIVSLFLSPAVEQVDDEAAFLAGETHALTRRTHALTEETHRLAAGNSSHLVETTERLAALEARVAALQAELARRR